MKRFEQISLAIFILLSLAMGLFLQWLKIEEQEQLRLSQIDRTLPLIEESVLNEEQEVVVQDREAIDDVLTEDLKKETPLKTVTLPKAKLAVNTEPDNGEIILAESPNAPVEQESIYKTVDNDTSIQKFVSPDMPFHDKTYVPHDLVALDDEHIVDLKGTAQMRKEASDQFTKMSLAFKEEFGKEIVVVSTYRSYDYQKRIKDGGCPDSLCSKAGHSEHQTGLAIDLWETTNYSTFMSKSHLKVYYAWMLENAADYGYHNSYQKGIEIDGYEREPWHWRYVGVAMAQQLAKNNITFTEFNSLQ